MLQGLDYLHRKCSIIHTDIKPENVLVTADTDYIHRMAGEAVFSHRYDVRMSSSSVSTAPEEMRQGNKYRKVKLRQPEHMNNNSSHNIEDSLNNNVIQSDSISTQRRKHLVRILE